ncbi:serine hydroxymethyltransferase [Mycoplasmoides pirum]|uniref:serine hydroxymethyltransferase n=1 Tax=Mycoplasmoides pirum TaxID=2122 RepID=UPI0004873090|nr:serine hydroxymethyltransferase [Mycoplasmoides pirum]
MVSKELTKLLNKELKRQQSHIELIASENFVSEDVLKVMGSILTNKYAEGFPGKRYYAGCEFIDQIESLAIETLKKIFNAKYADVQPASGSIANAIVYLALLKPNDKVLAMGLNEGGHLTHGSNVNFSGKIYNFHHYGVNPKTQTLDYDAILEQAIKIKPKLIVCGASNYSRKIDFKKFSEIAKKVNAYLMADVAHIAGLIVAKEHMNPLPYCDVVTSTTHKTLRGPRGGIIMSNNEAIFSKLKSASFPGTQGGPLEHIIAAKLVAFQEASKPAFKTYIKQVVKNSKTFAEVFKSNGYNVVANGTDNHLLSIDVFKKNKITGDQVENWLMEASIIVNKNTIPYDTNTPNKPSGIRLGTAAMTTRGFKEKDFAEIANWIIEIINSNGNMKIINKIKKLVALKIKKFPIYQKLKY